MDIIKTETGYVSGTIIGEPGKEVRIYRGIPYAAPPIGEFRWKPPQSAIPWTGIRECTVFSRQAAQIENKPDPEKKVEASEDCLYLNILVPENHGDSLPVMVWMHGGGFDQGTGNDRIFNNCRLPLNGVILVTVNTRLGALGLLANPALSKESPNNVSGNYLFLDLIAALKWIQKNIKNFSGDPDNVTIFGESGGGGKVANLIASPLAKGLFQKAICESGASFPPYAPGMPLSILEKSGEKFFEQLGVNGKADPLASARAIPWEKIVEVDKSFVVESMQDPGRWDAAVDGWYMPEFARNIFSKAKQNPVSLMVGANLGELTGPGRILMPQIIPVYVSMLNAMERSGVKNRFAYIFDKIPGGWKKQGCVSTHAMELGYVFGDYDDTTGFWQDLFDLTMDSGAKTPDPGVTASDRVVSEIIMKMWTNFARTGNPSIEGTLEWPVYDEKSDGYLEIKDTTEARSGFSTICQNLI